MGFGCLVHSCHAPVTDSKSQIVRMPFAIPSLTCLSIDTPFNGVKLSVSFNILSMRIHTLWALSPDCYNSAMKSSAKPETIDYAALRNMLQNAETEEQLLKVIVNAPFVYKVETTLMSLGIIVLLLVNKSTGTIDRIAISDNELAKRTKHRSAKRFEDIKIPLGHPDNIIAKAIADGVPQGTSDWQYMFVPELSPQDARFNQIEGGIGYSAVYPLVGARDGGAMIFSYFQYPERIHTVQEQFMQRYSELVTEFLRTKKR
jgi:hypothetical protein